MNEAELKHSDETNVSASTAQPQAPAEPAEATTQPAAAPPAGPEPATEAEAPATDAETPTSDAETPATDGETPSAERKTYHSKQEIIDRLKELVRENILPERSETEYLKQAYYKLHNAEANAQREKFIADGGNEADFLPTPDATESEFKAQMSLLKERRNQQTAAIEKERQDNLARKLEIIEKIKDAAASPDQADKSYNEIKQLQAEWKEIKNVPAEKSTELWKNYQLYVEQFYDQLRLNHEFRAYDFKKNLESKLHLCEAAEKLADVPDPVSAFHQLQKLHQEFREIGPVAKELREEVWERFKAASTVVNKRHQEHFERLKAAEEDNLAKKTALCEQIEAFSTDGLKTAADWDKATQHVLDLQAQWKTIGFTPRKMNAKIFERFRTACDAFFRLKSEHFKSMREAFSVNQAAKVALCEEAEALKDSTDWNATTNKFLQLQKKWKATGPVSRKASEALWKRFSAACNYYFEHKNAATAGQREEEESNLARKKAIIEQLAALLEQPQDGSAGADVQQTVRQLADEWNGIGHVPFRKKDKIYKQYRGLLDRIYDELHVSAGRRRMDNFRKEVAGREGNELTRERDRLYRSYEAQKQEIQTYENNLSFFNSKSKKGNSLVEELEKKVNRLKQDLELIAEKIKTIDQQIKAQAAAENDAAAADKAQA